MYARHTMQNFPQQLQTQLSQKPKDVSGFFIAFLKCTSSLEHFEKEDEPYTWSIPEIIDSTVALPKRVLK